MDKYGVDQSDPIEQEAEKIASENVEVTAEDRQKAINKEVNNAKHSNAK